MEAILTPSSRLGKLLHQFSHGDKIPTEFTTRQIVAALLLRRQDRSGTRQDILDEFVSLPSNKEGWNSCKTYVYDPQWNQTWEVVDEEAPVVRCVRVIASYLDKDKPKYFKDFLQLESLAPRDPVGHEAWLANKFRAVATQERDLDGSEADLDYGREDWVGLSEPDKKETLGRPAVHTFAMLPLKENCYFADFLNGWQEEGL